MKHFKFLSIVITVIMLVNAVMPVMAIYDQQDLQENLLNSSSASQNGDNLEYSDSHCDVDPYYMFDYDDEYGYDQSRLLQYKKNSDGTGMIVDGFKVNTAYVPYYVNIPSTFDGLPVVEVSSNAFNGAKEYLYAALMPSIRKINDNAFSYCYFLKCVEMPNVSEVGINCFKNTPWYNNLSDEFAVFGNGVLIKYCGLSTEVKMPENIKWIGGGVFKGNQTIVSVSMPNVQTIGDEAFSGCSSLIEIDMPNVQTIGDKAFCGCAMTSCKLPYVYTIGEEAFAYCSALVSIEIPSVTTLCKHTFDSCKSLTNVDALLVVSIDDCAFYECISLYSIKLPNVIEIGTQAFEGCISLANVEMPNVIEIGAQAFEGCKPLTNVEIPNASIVAANSFWETAWYNNLKDEFSIFGDGVLVKYCGSDTEVILPDNIKCIAGFYRNTSIVEVSIMSCNAIGSYEFYGCTSLRRAYFFTNPPEYRGNFIFDYCASDFSICFADDTTGWTAPTWWTYPTQEFEALYVTFIDCVDNSTIALCKTHKNGTVKAPEAPIHEGYTFIGWDTDFSNVRTDLTVTTVYETITHKVTFKDGISGNIIETATVDHGTDVTFPTAPEHVGYTFIGWDNDGKNITADITITANYAVNTYTVTFKDGLTGDIISIASVIHGEDVSLPTPPVHEGYTFTAWDNDGKSITADITITALYEINTYTVTFKDGLNGNTISTATVEYGKDVSFPNAPTHEGYTFSRWDNDGKNIKSNMTITALYKINTYTVTFVDGLTGETITTVTVEHGKDAQMPNAPEHDGYEFTGWDNDGKNITADTTITAQYELAVVTGDLNGDDKINTADAVVILKIAAGMIAQDDNNALAGDCNHDGKVNTADAVCILKYAAGMISEF